MTGDENLHRKLLSFCVCTILILSPIVACGTNLVSNAVNHDIAASKSEYALCGFWNPTGPTESATTQIMEPAPVLAAPLPPAAPARTSSAPIAINGDVDFAAQALTNAWPGDGTPGNPYLIENYEIDPEGALVDGIRIENTAVHFAIRNCKIFNTTFRDEFFNWGAYVGIYLSSVSNATLEGNYITLCMGEGMYLTDCTDVSILSNAIINNTYYADPVFGDKYGLIGIFIDSYVGLSRRLFVANNTISNNSNGEGLGYGIILYAEDSILEHNNISDDWRGIVLGETYNNIIRYNILSRFNMHGPGNGHYGVHVNPWEISSDNLFYANEFINNTDHAYDDYDTNEWDNGGDIGGNYWDDYPGVDADGDGYGDTPYIGIVGGAGAQDNYPLMERWSTPSGPVQNLNTLEYFETIQAAITDAETLDGHTITVKAGKYYEKITVNKQLTMIGKGSASTLIQGDGVGDVVHVSASNVHFSGFNLTGSGAYNLYYDSAIELNNVQNCLVTDIISWHCRYGIKLTDANDNVIENCVSSNFENGNGIRMDRSDGNYIANSTFSKNDDWGIRLLSSCDYNTFYHNNISENYGNILNLSNNNSILENTFWDNGIGLALDNSHDNIVHHNSFIGSTWSQATDNYAAGSWDDGYPSGGNYWSDYTGIDLFSGLDQDLPGSDNIGDTPYIIAGTAGAQDLYPLLVPWTPPVIVTFSINLSAGWNLISIPLWMTDTSVENVLSSVSGIWDVVKYYSPVDVADPWKTFRYGGMMNDLVFIDRTMGVWVHVTGNSVLEVSGTVPITTCIFLHPGWNLVGYPSLTQRTVGDALWGTGADHVVMFDAISPYFVQEIGPTYMMKSGEGYWVHGSYDTVWIINW